METMTNEFINTVFDKASSTLTENGAKTYITTKSAIVDQFGKAGNFRGRNIYEVFDDQAKIWAENAEAALRFPFYLRMVTRKVKVNDKNVTDKVQNGQGARDEAFKRLLWIAKEHPSAFYNNIWALPLVGSWKDIWTIMFYDIKENLNVIDKKAMFEVIEQGLLCNTHNDLVKKYLPRIKSQSKCTTDWTRITNELAKEFASFVHLSYKEYNKMKSSGNAHTFQKLICSRNYGKLVWNHIPGRALNLLVSGKFLSNHGLKENYIQWIMSQPVAKFTGYVFELAKRLREARGSRWGHRNVELPIEVKHTLDAQFNGLVEQARADGNITENVWCCLDTSGSMNQRVNGLKDIYCSDIATSLSLFFASLNTGAFHNKLIMFDNVSKPHDMVGESFCDRVMNLPSVGCGGTNFQSAIDEIIKIREAHPEIPLESYPTTVLVVSDMEFNPTNYGLWRSPREQTETNFEYSKNALKTVFPSDFVDNMKFIWWDCAARHGVTHFEGDSLTAGCHFFSGFDGSIINVVLGNDSKVVDERTGETRQMTAEEVVAKALNQEILTYLKVEE